jgi:hypothetical protein
LSAQAVVQRRIQLAACTAISFHCANVCFCLQVAQRCEECDCEALLLQAGAQNKQQDSWQGFAGGEL